MQSARACVAHWWLDANKQMLRKARSEDTHSLFASRVMALTANLSVCSSDWTTDVPCLLVACTTAMMGLTAAIASAVLVDYGEAASKWLVFDDGYLILVMNSAGF